MRPRLDRIKRHLHALLTGVRFTRSLERYERAAEDLDKAVREVLAR